MIASKAKHFSVLISFCLPIHKPLGKFLGIINRLVYGLSHVTSVLPDSCLTLGVSQPSWCPGANPNSQGHGRRICILWPCSITMKQSESCGRVVNRYKCQFLSFHLSTSGFLLDILASLWCTFTGSVCTLRLFNNAFYVHILFTFFHGVSWQRIKYIYFKGVWEPSLHFHFQ